MNLGFVGMGNMGQMLVKALTGSGALDPVAVCVSNRSPEKLDQIATLVPGIQTVRNAELARRCQTIFLCIKPGETPEVLREMGPYITPDHLLITITNTLEIPVLERAVPARVAKVIPSIVQTVGKGVSLLMFGERCITADRTLLVGLFSSISRPYVIQESQARVASDLTSCGPAFLAYMLSALMQAARRYEPGLPAETVHAMIHHTVGATVTLMERMGYSFDDVIARVSTPGGITADGIKELDKHMAGVWERVVETTLIKEEQKKAKVEL